MGAERGAVAAPRRATGACRSRRARFVLDDLLALRMAEARLRSDMLVSASIEPRSRADGTPQTLAGSILARGRLDRRPATIPSVRFRSSSAEFGLDWDAARRTLRVPFKITSGATRFTLRSEFAAPAQPGGNWLFALGGGWVVLDPLTAGRRRRWSSSAS